VVKITTTAGLFVTSRDVAPMSNLGNPIYTPGVVKADISSVGILQKVMVTAKNEGGFTSKCNFLVATEGK